MFAWGKDDGINAVRCMEGSFTVDETLGVHAELTMVYTNAKTGASFGSCKASEDLFSESTMRALQEFMNLAERDYGLVAAGKRTVEDSYSAKPGAPTSPSLHMPLGGE